MDVTGHLEPQPSRGDTVVLEPSPPEPSVQLRTARRGHAHPRVRHYLRSLDGVGGFVALVSFLLSLTPSLQPRRWWVQGVVSGVAAASGYATGVAVAWLGRRVGIRPVSARTRRTLRRAVAGFAAFAVPAMLWLSASWQNAIRNAVGAPVADRYLYIGVFALAVLVAVVLVAIGRLVHDLYAAAVSHLRRFVPSVAAKLTAMLLVAALLAGLLSGVIYRGLLTAADRLSAAYDRGNDPGIVQTTSRFRSGGPGSLVSWDSLGRRGRAFISTGPTAADIERLTHRHATPPIRAYAGLSSAPTLHGEAELVLAELKRTHAFDRALLGVATSTGSGGVERQLADPLEYMYDGDTALAAMQYSHLPSWVAFLVDGPRAREAGRTLFNTVYDYWSTLPATHRPKLVVFGESLGAFGASAAFSGVADLTARTSGALFTGTPNETELWRDLTNARNPGTPQWLPVYGDGKTVRFAGSAADLRNPDGSLRHPKLVFVQHASDPVVWWSTDLIWRRPDWLREPRGPDVAPQMRWFPFLTFWQVTADLAIKGHTPAGYGHHYGPEVPTAWAAILHPPHWTRAETRAVLPLVMFPR